MDLDAYHDRLRGAKDAALDAMTQDVRQRSLPADALGNAWTSASDAIEALFRDGTSKSSRKFRQPVCDLYNHIARPGQTDDDLLTSAVTKAGLNVFCRKMGIIEIPALGRYIRNPFELESMSNSEITI